MAQQTRKHFGLVLITFTFLVLSLYCGAARAYDGSIQGSIGSGKVYYKVGGFTNTAFFELTFSSSFNLQMRLYDDEGNWQDTASPPGTGQQIIEYLPGGYTYYVEISYISGTGTASFTLTYQNVYTIAYYGTAAPFTTGVDQLTALAIGAPIILGVGFAIIGIFGRMKLRPRKVEVPYVTPSTATSNAPPSSPSRPAVPATPPASAPVKRFCPYCGTNLSSDAQVCTNCGSALK